jgi:hypothetical protein
MYQITENIVLNKWLHFTDHFRYMYRKDIYKE